MIKVSKSHVCGGGASQSAIMDKTSMYVGDGASLELVDQFCYLGDNDMLTAECRR